MTQNHFQVFLGNYKVKGKGFVVKGVVLFGMGVLAIFGAAVLFAAGYHFLLGKEGIGMRYVRLTGTLIFGSVPLYLEDLLYSYRENQVDAAVLGCTHYPFARKQIQQVLGENVKIFDGGEGTAREMKRRLQEKDLLCGRQKRGQVVFENSLTDDSKIELCKKLLNI